MKYFAFLLLMFVSGCVQQQTSSLNVQEEVSEMKISLLGHASVLIQSPTLGNIYIDPYEGAYEKLPKADFILITHEHYDHFDAGKISTVKKQDTIIIAAKGVALNLSGANAMKAGDEKTFNGLKVKAVEAYNTNKFKAPGQPFHPKGLGVGYIIEVEGQRLYHAGDTDLIDEMKNLGKIDIAFLPISGTYVMTIEEAVEALKIIKPKVVYPMHAFKANPNEFIKKAKDVGFEAKI